MISLIVCSINDRLFADFSSSVRKTIGLPYEIIRIENKAAQFSISAAYNKGARQARYDYLCFVHEDVAFHTDGWGIKLCDYLENLKEVGVIGVAGSDYFCSVAHGWAIRDKKHLFVNAIQGYKYSNQTDCHIQINPSSVKRLLLLDGFFLAVKKAIWQHFLFDESIGGFHGYDLSFCLRIATKHTNYFVPDILLTHFSEGKPDVHWYHANINVRKLWHTEVAKLREMVPINLKIEKAVFYESLHNITHIALPATAKWMLIMQYLKFSIRVPGLRHSLPLFIKFIASVSYNRCKKLVLSKCRSIR